ncbi:hypothetical protein [Zhihengliuella flava]|uniref:Uncharacterized protein n=1 Tax=Zhihengliuella flava TaxID=1285193 RepID=A0A931GF01_9MICC|nr:hypothetical protein [Zhihengliuella flava]MBG6084122.1 hypothetical protein [Zhihengliuella flava]
MQRQEGVMVTRWVRQWWRPGVMMALFAVGGAAVGRVMPPFVLDDPLWRDFWTGPPAAGVFALVGAAVAFVAATKSARVQRRAAERQEWWDRAEWAFNLAMSEDDSSRYIGLKAFEALETDATRAEYAMMAAVTTAVAGDAPMDGQLQGADNDGE